MKLGYLVEKSLQGEEAFKFTCLEAQSSLARTRLISSVEEVEESFPYSPVDLENIYIE